MKKPTKPTKPSPPSETVLVTNEIRVYDREVNLKDVLLDAEHKGYNTSDIKIEAEMDDWSSYGDCFQCIIFQFGQTEVKNPRFETLMCEYQKRLAIYEQKLEKYNEQLPLYQAWLKSEENKKRERRIKQLEKELAAIKRSSPIVVQNSNDK